LAARLAACGIRPHGTVVSPEGLWNTGFMWGAKYKLFLRLAIGFAVVNAGNARGDEFHLKDGSKVVGTIVSYENDSFKVQTSYGFAYVRKDSIAEIVPTEKKAAPDSGQQPAALKPSVFSAAPPSAKAAVPPMPRPIPSYANPSKSSTATRTGTSVAPPTIAANSASPFVLDLSGLLPGQALDPRAQPMQEVVRGNLYVNQTYGFQMYKSPTWQVIKNPQNELPNAIGALGTDDQSTLLVIGRDPLKDTLDAQAAKRERTMRDVYENYRSLGKKQVTIAGLPAIEQRFYGNLDGRDWSVTVTMLARGGDVFTILGMTSADSDLIQIQENVIAKTIASLQFLSPQ
jgi:hypothetical protein